MRVKGLGCWVERETRPSFNVAVFPSALECVFQCSPKRQESLPVSEALLWHDTNMPLTCFPICCRARREHRKGFRDLLPECRGQNLALTFFVMIARQRLSKTRPQLSLLRERHSLRHPAAKQKCNALNYFHLKMAQASFGFMA